MSLPMMDANAWDAITLGATLAVRDTLVLGKPDLKDAGSVAVGQYTYKKWVEAYVAPKLAQLTGETMISGLASNALGLSAVIMAMQSVGLMKKDEKYEDGGVAPKVKGKGVSTKVINALVQGTELLIEQQLLLKVASMASVGIPAGQPSAALAK